jgi:hypothetical protein
LLLVMKRWSAGAGAWRLNQTWIGDECWFSVPRWKQGGVAAVR